MPTQHHNECSTLTDFYQQKCVRPTEVHYNSYDHAAFNRIIMQQYALEKLKEIHHQFNHPTSERQTATMTRPN